jgi:beta-galactosidase
VRLQAFARRINQLAMKQLLPLCCFLLLSVPASAQKNQHAGLAARITPFDNGWLFTKDSVTHAEQVKFSDTGWQKVELPHDWSIDDLPDQTAGETVGPFTKSAIGKGATGFTLGGTGWYRKRFVTGKEMQGKLVNINFDGVYMNSDVWLNGHHLGNHPYGYTPFNYDLTPYLNAPGQQNILAVRVKNEGRNSRWYSGSGIYRHVWLTTTNTTHIIPWGIYIITPTASAKTAAVTIKTTLNKGKLANGKVTLVTTLIGPGGKIAAVSHKNLYVANSALLADSQTLVVPQPVLWDVNAPRLYKALSEIKVNGKITDHVETPFGIRTVHIDAATGFMLNGKRVMLKGGCIHHDNGPLGAVAIGRAEERKIELLKRNGYNAIRTSHNPPSKELLDACDRLGMLVIDEAFDMWQKGKNPADYHLYFDEWSHKDLEAMILRDRNHPSVIIWSIGNEIPERVDSAGLAITKKLVAGAHYLDPTRPVTEALCFFWEPANQGKTWASTAPAFAILDAGGYNYQLKEYQEDHKLYPHRLMIGTESFPGEALENWNMVEQHPYLLGDFVWTAMDYMGEASIGNTRLDTVKSMKFDLGWPWYNAWCGDIDLIGNKKPQSYYRDVVWRQKPIAMAVHMPVSKALIENVSPWGWPFELQSWTWPGNEGKDLEVRVFSRAAAVRLLLNGNTIGEQQIPAGSITAVFKVPYQPGTLTAVNVTGGKASDSITFKTAGKAKRIRLTADKARISNSRDALSYVIVEVVDANNRVVPDAEIPIHFTVSGTGELAAAGNASPNQPASFRQPQSNTFRGRCIAILRPTGKTGTIHLKATAAGLPAADVDVLVGEN